MNIVTNAIVNRVINIRTGSILLHFVRIRNMDGRRTLVNPLMREFFFKYSAKLFPSKFLVYFSVSLEVN